MRACVLCIGGMFPDVLRQGYTWDDSYHGSRGGYDDDWKPKEKVIPQELRCKDGRMMDEWQALWGEDGTPAATVVPRAPTLSPSFTTV